MLPSTPRPFTDFSAGEGPGRAGPSGERAPANHHPATHDLSPTCGFAYT